MSTAIARETRERGSVAIEPPPLKNRRLNLNLSEQAYADVNVLAKDTRRSITELVRLGLGLVKIALQESRSGNKIIVTTSDGKPIKELVLPGL